VVIFGSPEESTGNVNNRLMPVPNARVYAGISFKERNNDSISKENKQQ